ncbi:Solute carrier organic anion transporter family member 1A6 [Chelonia mydas]|uniref:Solute carrier organic anion transporter family member 1C1 n=1 Tax=Chelonia mydas TaxID=8469 RepID=M7AIX0_CHEMY|nr:Solute carrier organic anion transporter family member 1A6 [Chelonia mydas]
MNSNDNTDVCEQVEDKNLLSLFMDVVPLKSEHYAQVQQVFLLASSFAYLAKTMSGAYMNSMLTQIERRFNIPASLVGIINGSFEIGNLLMIAFVSYFGAKLHRPRIITLGCTVMSFGCLLISLPHFLMERYQYETALSPLENSSSSMSMCLINQSQSFTPMEKKSAECEQKSGSLMWVFVLVGNMIRGIGETPIMPLVISYVEDFSKAENSPFYIGCLQIATVIGPFIGFMLGSYCAQLYVDLGFTDIAVYNLPVICIGYFLGGFLMKKFKISTIQAANIAFWISLIEYLIYFAAYFTVCENSPVAGLTVSYEGIEQVSYMETTLLADCNSDCDCSSKVWDPVCGKNGITYVSPCLAGCKASDGTSKYITFLLNPGFVLEMAHLDYHTHSGIPSPIYFGALIDTTCLKWGTLSCGGEGACRMYDIVTYRWLYLGLPAILRGLSYIPCVLILLILKKQLKSSEEKSLNSSPMATEVIEEQK